MIGIWRITFTLLALSSNELVCGMRTSLSEEDNAMMVSGTFVYDSQSERNKEILFEDFVKAFAREVIPDSRQTR